MSKGRYSPGEEDANGASRFDSAAEAAERIRQAKKFGNDPDDEDLRMVVEILIGEDEE